MSQLKSMLTLMPGIGKCWMLDISNEHRATSIAYLKSCQLPNLLFFLIIVCAQLQYHHAAIAQNYQESLTIKGSYSELVKKGSDAYKQNKFADAEVFFKSALEKKETVDVYINLGHVYMTQKRFGNAIDAYIKASAVEPENLKPIPYLGAAYMSNNDYRNALRIFQRISKQEELDSDIFISIGICLENMGNSEGALNAFGNAVALSPLSKDANLRLASALHNSGKLEEALGVYQYILQEWPGIIGVLVDIGNIYLEMERYDNAIDIFESAQRLGVGGEELNRTIADLYLSENMYKEASLSYQRFIKSSLTQSAEDHYRLANAYYMGGENHSACKALEKAIEKNPDYGKAHLLLGNIYFEEMELDKAFEEYENAIKREPKLAAAHIALTNLFMEKGEIEKAISEYRTVINLGQKDAPIFYNLIVMLLEEGRYEESVKTVKDALRIHPKDNSLKNLLAMVLKQTNLKKE